MRAEVDAAIEEALEYATEAPYPDSSEAYDDMFEESVPEIEAFAQQAGARTDGGDR